MLLCYNSSETRTNENSAKTESLHNTLTRWRYLGLITRNINVLLYIYDSTWRVPYFNCQKVCICSEKLCWWKCSSWTNHTRKICRHQSHQKLFAHSLQGGGGSFFFLLSNSLLCILRFARSSIIYQVEVILPFWCVCNFCHYEMNVSHLKSLLLMSPFSLIYFETRFCFLIL